MALYDPGNFPCEVATPPSVDFTVADVLAWARTRPADEAYEYVDGRNCAMCQFLRGTGRAAEPRVGFGWRDGDGAEHPLPWNLCSAAFGDGGKTTFGGLVKRLEALSA
jgi:hypothetical protein